MNADQRSLLRESPRNRLAVVRLNAARASAREWVGFRAQRPGSLDVRVARADQQSSLQLGVLGERS